MEDLVSLKKYFSNKRVLVTGHTGFKGSWLCIYLKMLGAEVHGIALAPKEPESIFEIANVEKGVCTSSTIDNICNTHSVSALLQDIQPEIVFHLAAQPLVIEGYNDPVETFNTNIMGVVSILESIRTCQSVEAFVNVTTDKCYENKEWCYPYRETDRLGGHDPYSASKACAEIVTNSYRQSYFPDKAIATARAGNVIGGGDWAQNRLLPDIIKAFNRGDEIEIRNPSSIRPWQHVLEPLTGYLVLAKKLGEKQGEQFSGAWNFGPHTSKYYTVGEVVKEVALCWGETANIVIGDANGKLHETDILMLDCSKARLQLEFEGVLSIQKAISLTVDWYKAFYEKKDMNIFTEKQIAQYWALRN